MSRAENYLALCLVDAIEDQNLDSLRILLEKHSANPNAIVLEKNVAPVHLVIGAENALLAEQATRMMLLYGADPNLRSDEEGITPLHIAANLGRARLVDMLLNAGGDLDQEDDEGKRPVEYAIEEGNFEVVKLMQNFIFEKKFERKRQQMLQNQQQNGASNGGGYIKCLGGYLRVGTPTKNCLSTVQALDDSKLTPNRVHYNFDVTSPYYINITHRRKDRTKSVKEDINQSILDLQKIELEENDEKNIPPNDEEEVVVGRKNLFELTERNLANFTRNMKGNGRRSSFIECWRDKIATLRNKNKLSTNIEDIERILSGFSDTSIHAEEQLENPEENEEHEVSVDSPDDDRNGSFITALEHVPQYEDSLRTNEFALALCPTPEPEVQQSPRPSPPDNRIVQITEEYIHTDDEAGVVFFEKKFLAAPVPKPAQERNQRQRHPSISSQSTALTLPPLDYDTDVLRAELTNFGEPPGPITKHTKKLYLKKLVKYKRDPERALAHAKDKRQPQYSVELLATLRCADNFQEIPEQHPLETEMSAEFQTTTEKAWREGHLKKSFIYLLIDPRISENLPAQQKLITSHELWKRFLQSIFYVGKGKSSRPYCHLYDAMKLYQQKSAGVPSLKPPPESGSLQVDEEQVIFQSEECIERVCNASKVLNRKQMNDSEKLNRIIDIWRAQQGVICLHVFHNIIPAEAYTREAAIIDALGIQNLTNLKRGDYYGKALSWPMKRRKQLGILLLHKAMLIFLAEGETQLLPSDLI